MVDAHIDIRASAQLIKIRYFPRDGAPPALALTKDVVVKGGPRVVGGGVQLGAAQRVMKALDHLTSPVSAGEFEFDPAGERGERSFRRDLSQSSTTTSWCPPTNGEAMATAVEKPMQRSARLAVSEKGCMRGF